MKMKKIKVINYQYGNEKEIKEILYKSKEPLLLKIDNFPDKFTLDYFEDRIEGPTSYSTFKDNRCVSHQTGDFKVVISEIKKNMPHRIFGQILSRRQSSDIERHVPLWQKIPFRPKFFETRLKVIYFFGGKGSHTAIHFDREQCSNLHLCLSGKKRVLLFTEEQSDALYKVPFISDSLIDFSQPLDELCKEFPRLKDAQGYDAKLEQGDMLFMPRNCWHYTEYLDASSAGTYVFYPKKILQFYGHFTGFFYIAYKSSTIYGLSKWPIIQNFSRNYALSTGTMKYFYKLIEAILFIFLLPVLSIPYMIWYNYKRIKLFLTKGL